MGNQFLIEQVFSEAINLSVCWSFLVVGITSLPLYVNCLLIHAHFAYCGFMTCLLPKLTPTHTLPTLGSLDLPATCTWFDFNVSLDLPATCTWFDFNMIKR